MNRMKEISEVRVWILDMTMYTWFRKGKHSFETDALSLQCQSFFEEVVYNGFVCFSQLKQCFTVKVSASKPND